MKSIQRKAKGIRQRSAALGCYIAALHQLYLAGMAMELNALGYHMTPLNQN